MTRAEWDELTQTVLKLSDAEKLELSKLLARSAHFDPTSVESPAAHRGHGETLIGLMADEPELVDRVLEAAMIGRARDSLRVTADAEDAP